MSLQVMAMVWGTSLPDSEMVVALALADRADDDGVCWPSMEWLEWKTNKSERTVRNAVGGLVGRGALKRVERPGEGVFYHLQLEVLKGLAKPKPLKRARLSPAAPPVAVAASGNPGNGCRGSEGEPRQGRGGEPRQPLPPIPEDKPNTTDTDVSVTGARAQAPKFEDFGAFWQAWPNKVGVEKARRVWGGLVKAGSLPPLAELVAAVDRYRTGKPADRQWLNPATWLADGRWMDGRGDEGEAQPGEVWAAVSTADVSAGLQAAVSEACGPGWTSSWLNGAVERDGRLTPRTAIGWERMRQTPAFMAVLAALRVELAQPAARRASG